MHLDELPGHEGERRTVGALEDEMTHGRRKHAAGDEAERKMIHRRDSIGSFGPL